MAETRPIKVLIIEEDRETRRLMRSALEAGGCSVAEAARGEIGLELAKRFGPALIVLDLALSDLEGHVVLQELKREVLTADVPVIVLSDIGDLHRNIPSHLAAARLVKPIPAEQLLAAVRRAVEAHHQQQPLDGWIAPHET